MRASSYDRLDVTPFSSCTVQNKKQDGTGHACQGGGCLGVLVDLLGC